MSPYKTPPLRNLCLKLFQVYVPEWRPQQQCFFLSYSIIERKKKTLLSRPPLLNINIHVSNAEVGGNNGIAYCCNHAFVNFGFPLNKYSNKPLAIMNPVWGRDLRLEMWCWNMAKWMNFSCSQRWVVVKHHVEFPFKIFNKITSSVICLHVFMDSLAT